MMSELEKLRNSCSVTVELLQCFVNSGFVFCHKKSNIGEMQNPIPSRISETFPTTKL